ncbi:hypothetical protein [Bdellovibrio svalbardensis]|uniref:Uncharacterized protein n=1 Tax=Bdellovibrio svalbardensis TaxID=2972972 RepID=A0ABT6DHD4_9BACT|nr:hypothetical protein [Bdellovibrio svalbardensis]MDG0815329.1 hypothetical protein [Bdellovibrio svalbardensis]
MKKEFMASVLTLTAGMASTISFPQYALAKSTHQAEKSYAKQFTLALNAPARYTDQDGKVIPGRIKISLDQTPFTPHFQNQLHGEMSGNLYFESDAYTSEYNGQKYKTVRSLIGDDGEALIDLVNRSATGGNEYRIYGCNSTLTSCDFSQFSMSFGGSRRDHLVEMSLTLSAEDRIEILAPQYVWNEKTQKMESTLQWSLSATSLEMVRAN